MSSIANPKSPKTSKDRLSKISSASSIGVEEDDKTDDELKEVVRKSQQELPGVPTKVTMPQEPNNDNNSLQNRRGSGGKYASKVGNVEDYYEIGKRIGKGAFSVVYEAKDKITGTHYAVKCINRKYIKEKLLEREIDIMTKIRHENILFCRDVFESESYIFLVLELVKGGELYDKIVDEGEYTEEEAKEIVYQILNAVEYLHENQIAHRDLKPENILCSRDPNSTPDFRRERIKVADFGLAKMFDRELLLSQCGSPTYVVLEAPEVLMGIAPYTEAVDMWAIGVITLTGCFPFYDDSHNYRLLYQKIINVDYVLPDDIPLSEEVEDFIKSLLIQDPKKRVTPAECKLHPWMREVHQREQAKKHKK